MARRWVIAGGGTGGHVTPALALGEALTERGEEVLFIGSSRGLESRLVPAAGFDLEVLPSEQFMGRSVAGRLRSLFSILRSVIRAMLSMRKFKADAVLSVGGYAAAPSAVAAWLTRRPLFLVEPNAIPGRVNRLTSPFARIVFVGFRRHSRSLARARAQPFCWRAASPRTLQSLLEGPKVWAALDAATHSHLWREPRALGSSMRMFPKHSHDWHRIRSRSSIRPAKPIEKRSRRVMPSCPSAQRSSPSKATCPARYRWADLAICRAGALTVAELALAGVPALLVPYPFASDDHQSAKCPRTRSRWGRTMLERAAPRPDRTRTSRRRIRHFARSTRADA